MSWSSIWTPKGFHDEKLQMSCVDSFYMPNTQWVYLALQLRIKWYWVHFHFSLNESFNETSQMSFSSATLLVNASLAIYQKVQVGEQSGQRFEKFIKRIWRTKNGFQFFRNDVLKVIRPVYPV